jgi:microcystin-dependent protein
MKNNTIYFAFSAIILLGIFGNFTFAQVGFNNPNPAPSSIIDLTANDKGLLIPRMTTGERSAISNPANGLLVFDISLKTFCYYDTVSNPDKWVLLSGLKTDANPNGHTTLVTSGNVGLGVSAPIHKLDVAGNIRSSDTVIAATGKFTGTITASGFSGNGSVPSGAIIMWYGTTPPSGWVICDGTNGTPDLRGRFVVGAGTNSSPASGDINPTYTVGATGGENKHVLSISELPKHKHTITSSTVDNGQANIQSAIVTDNYFAHSVVPIAGSPQVSASGEFTSATTQSLHTHTISGSTGDGTTDGANSQPHENRPPYYVLTYIMKQ